METIIKKKDTVVLTDKMVEVIYEMSKGKKAKDVAAKQKLSVRTIEKQIENMKAAYKCKSITHLACHFIRLGIIK